MSANNIIELSLLILVLPLVSTKVDEPYICEQRGQEADCQNMYQLTQCLDDHCSQNITFNFGCCAVCDTLLTPDCDQTEEQHKIHLDTFFSKHCASDSLTSFETDRSIVTALGVLLGLCVVLLLVATTGWVCTCRALKALKHTQSHAVKNSLEEERIAEESTATDDEVEKHVQNPLHEESVSVHNYPVGSTPRPRQDSTNMPPPTHDETFNQNDAILNIIKSGATVPLSAAVDDQKEKYLKNPIYEGGLEFQADRYYERENYDCSQDDNDHDYIYNALEQGSSPERDTESKRFSDPSSIITARREENKEISSDCEFSAARYDAVSRPCYKEGEDYDILDHEFHVGSNRVAASSFECNEEKYFQNPIYKENPCSLDKLTRVQDIQAVRFNRAISSFQEDSQDYDILEPESDITHMVPVSTPPLRYENISLALNKNVSSYVDGPKAVVPIAKPRTHLRTARCDTVNLPSHGDDNDEHDDGGDYDVLES